MKIRALLQLYPLYSHEEVTIDLLDPLWPSWELCDHFLNNFAAVSVPVVPSTLDENTIRCKARTSARNYMKSKPVKFGIRFYLVIGWDIPYI